MQLSNKTTDLSSGSNACPRRLRGIGQSILALSLVATVLVGCSPSVKVEPPDKPIEINLNVRIEQEVRIKIERELEEVFAENKDIF